MEKDTRSSPLFLITLIVDIIALLMGIFCRVMAREPSGNIINDTLLGDLRTYKILINLSDAGILLFMFLLGALVVLGFRGKFPFYLILAGLGIWFFGICFVKAVPPILNKPEVITAVCTDREIHVNGRHSHKVRYQLSFDNGSSIRKKGAEYSDAVGKSFYVVMCGDTAIEAYDPAEYSLTL